MGEAPGDSRTVPLESKPEWSAPLTVTLRMGAEPGWRKDISSVRHFPFGGSIVALTRVVERDSTEKEMFPK